MFNGPGRCLRAQRRRKVLAYCKTLANKQRLPVFRQSLRHSSSCALCGFADVSAVLSPQPHHPFGAAEASKRRAPTGQTPDQACPATSSATPTARPVLTLDEQASYADLVASCGGASYTLQGRPAPHNTNM